MKEIYTAACGCKVTLKLHAASDGDEDIHVVWVSERCDGKRIEEPHTVTLTA